MQETWLWAVAAGEEGREWLLSGLCAALSERYSRLARPQHPPGPALWGAFLVEQQPCPAGHARR
jgi:hypothetical protein